MKRIVAIGRVLVALVLTPLLTAALLAPSGVVRAAPEPGSAAGGSVLYPALSLLLNTLGDDAFSLVNASAAMAPTPTQHYGPYSSTSPDSSTCGNNWAEDTFDRDFTVHNNNDGTYTIDEQFKNGSFVTMAGPSPGACDPTDGTPPGTISAGKVGDMHGYEIITVTGTQISQDASCGPGDCTTATFIASHFAGASTVGTYFFHYSAGDQNLTYHEWKNASSDRGGNHGDIADAP